MAAIDTRTLPLFETAVMLRAKLGRLRNWVNFLNDNVRARQDVCGHQLLPCGQQHDGRSYRPIYSMVDIEEFVGRVLAALPGAGREPITPIILPVDRCRHWRANRFDKHGAPVAMLRASHHGGVRNLTRSISWRAKRGAVSAMIQAY